MKKLALIALFISHSLFAADNINQECITNKYDAYIDTSLTWYQDLVNLTSDTRPELADVGKWFLLARTHHFELNRAAFHYYLDNDVSKIDLDNSVESWLNLSQTDVKALTQREDELGKIAKESFQDRQSPPHPKNYELRSAFADILSHPKNIQPALDKYNASIVKINEITCQ